MGHTWLGYRRSPRAPHSGASASPSGKRRRLNGFDRGAAARPAALRRSRRRAEAELVLGNRRRRRRCPSAPTPHDQRDHDDRGTTPRPTISPLRRRAAASGSLGALRRTVAGLGGPCGSSTGLISSVRSAMAVACCSRFSSVGALRMPPPPDRARGRGRDLERDVAIETGVRRARLARRPRPAPPAAHTGLPRAASG